MTAQNPPQLPKPVQTEPQHAGTSPLKQETPVCQHGPMGPVTTHPRGKHRGIIWMTVIILLAGLAWFLLWFYDFRWRQFTDDAYVNGSMINVTPVVSGSPIAFFADDTDLVKEGQLLVLLDETPFKLALDKELSTLATTTLQVAQFFNSVKANIANLESKRIVYERLKYDYDNRVQLIGSLAVSGEDYTHARDLMDQAEQDLKQAQAQLNVTIDQAGHVINTEGQLKTPLEEHPLILAQKAVIREAYYNLKHCAVYAPATGFVAQRAVQVGQWVTPTSYMMGIIPIDYMWVDANYKETQLTEMRIGQPSRVYIDLYGSDVVYKGKVMGIASGTGNVFSLIPPQNATGNWIKIVQRLPVRISLDPEIMENFPLRLGLSAEVYVDITNTDLPKLSQVPPTNPVTTTRVFELNFEEIDQEMNQIIHKNLGNNHS